MAAVQIKVVAVVAKTHVALEDVAIFAIVVALKVDVAENLAGKKDVVLVQISKKFY